MQEEERQDGSNQGSPTPVLNYATPEPSTAPFLILAVGMTAFVVIFGVYSGLAVFSFERFASRSSAIGVIVPVLAASILLPMIGNRLALRVKGRGWQRLVVGACMLLNYGAMFIVGVGLFCWLLTALFS